MGQPYGTSVAEEVVQELKRRRAALEPRLKIVKHSAVAVRKVR